ncbi:hypothetical protein [Nocardioides soli]|uniref:Uncharacterized protein n=1 Tax=Nocardioides soli TaxID=1036020 RepID=A0A7W4VSW2_9ACTN|nr:hypothetical protein [Nocardioides soli]MBB3041185.1 hypothetical protein [Nocardioides soli]
MSALAVPLHCQETAAAVATRDRAATADQLIDVACKDAIRLLRGGRAGMAEYRLARAGTAADRILGTTTTKDGAR